MKVGDLVKHRTVSLGIGLVTGIHRRYGGCEFSKGPSDKMVYVLWPKHKKLPRPNLEIPESLEIISETR